MRCFLYIKVRQLHFLHLQKLSRPFGAVAPDDVFVICISASFVEPSCTCKRVTGVTPIPTCPSLSILRRSLVELDAPVSKINPPLTPLLAALIRPRTCFVLLSCCSKARKTLAPSALDESFKALPDEPR